jgi:hypothetical protein
VTIRGILALEIDEPAVEARVTIVPDAGGQEITAESIVALLREKGAREGIDTEAIEKGLRALARRKGETVAFVAAAGIPPTPPEPEVVEFAPLPVPPRLADAAREALARAAAPALFRERVEKVRVEKQVKKRPALAFLGAKDEVQVAWEKKTIREPVEVDPAVRATGWAEAGSRVATVRPGRPGREGRNIMGRIVPASRGHGGEWLFGEGLVRSREAVTAERSGFLRRGDTWCDLVPFRDHRTSLGKTPDGLTCLLDVEPGGPGAPPLDASEVLAAAEKLGFERHSLLAPAELDALLRRVAAAQKPVSGIPLSRRADGAADIVVTPDRLRARLTIRRGRGGGRPLTLADITAAVRASGVKSFDAEKVRADILAFWKGPALSLDEYPLAAGREPQPGADGKLHWLAAFLPAEEVSVVKKRAAAHADRLAGLASLAAFPPEAVEAVAWVTPGTVILKTEPPQEGRPGTDVFGKTIPAPRGRETELRLFEGLARGAEGVTATAGGILEKGSDGMAVRLRVRPHRDAALSVSVAADRMSAAVSYVPFEGTGNAVDPEAVQAALAKAGVAAERVDPGRLLGVLDAVRRNIPLAGIVVAEGKRPGTAGDRLTIHVRVATGKAVAVAEDGRADFRAQDRITRVSKGEPLATLLPARSEATEGWDVTGAVIPPPPEAEQDLAAGPGVSAALEPDGSTRFFAGTDGELVLAEGRVEVRQVHEIAGDVSMDTGNVKFPGSVRVDGSVLSGFAVVADGNIAVQEVVQAAVLAAGGSVEIGRGIKGEEKAVIRARGSVTTGFAEQATIACGGDVRVRGACLFCRLTCNGRLVLETDKGSVMGGVVRARQGVVAQNLGSPGGARTLVSFGQDYLLLERIEKATREIAKLKARVAELDTAMRELVRAAARDDAALASARSEKLSAMKAIEQKGLLLIGMRDRFDEHVQGEVVVKGTLYPGVVVESHGRRFSVSTEKSNLRLFFSRVEGKILEKL